jgi:hypothetical protein
VVVGDATAAEVADLANIVPQLDMSSSIRFASSVESRLVSWAWQDILAFCEMTLLDGEKGIGKSLVIDFIIACATRGWPMPGQSSALMPPCNVFYFTDEGAMESVQRPRLEAAGADLSRVAFPAPEQQRRGKKVDDWELGLPAGAGRMGSMIRQASARIAFWDPITDFLAEDVHSHNDASVRRALRPLGAELVKAECAGFAVRHMNKDTKQEARYRGSGSSAFQNRARVHLIAGRMPDSHVLSGGAGDFGIAMVDSNMSEKMQGVLAYSIVDSEVVQDVSGGMVGRAEFIPGLVTTVTADQLAGGERRKGPEATAQPTIRAAFMEMFQEQDTWDKNDAVAELEARGCSVEEKTVTKVRRILGIRSVGIRQKGKAGIRKWVWTTRKARISERDD